MHVARHVLAFWQPTSQMQPLRLKLLVLCIGAAWRKMASGLAITTRPITRLDLGEWLFTISPKTQMLRLRHRPRRQHALRRFAVIAIGAHGRKPELSRLH